MKTDEIASPAASRRSAAWRRTWLVLLASGALGFIVGALIVPTWQDAVELAQVHAGLIPYRPDAPFFLYAMRTWTLLAQVPAVLLRAGLSERTVSVLLSGAMGALSFQALAAIILAICDDAWMASLAPILVFATGAASGGLTYPVLLAGTNFTYGVFGLSGALLALGLLAGDAPVLGAFVLGVLPAVHASLAAWLLAIVIAVAVWAGHAAALWRTTWRGFLAGASITATSFIVFVCRRPAVSPADRADASLYLRALLAHWDMHVQPLPIQPTHLLPIIVCVTLAAASLGRRSPGSRRVSILFGGIVLAACIGGGIHALRYAGAALPAWLLVLMPARLLNLSIASGMAITIGIARRNRADVRSQWVLAALITALAVLTAIGIWWESGPRWSVGAWMLAAVALLVRARRRGVEAVASTPRSPSWLARVTAATLMAAALATAGTGLARAKASPPDFRNWTNDPFFAAVAASPGVVLTGSNIAWIQLLTRRPVLLSGALLDALVYVPEVAPSMNRALHDAYGFDFFHPPDDTDVNGAPTPESGHRLWEARTPEEWRRIRDEFNVTDVVTYADWTLQLPVVARNADLVLYAIR